MPSTMSRYFLIPVALLLSICSAPLLAGPGDAERHIRKGIDELYNVEFDNAARSFDAAIAADRNDPSGYFFRANVHLWSYLFDRREDQLRQYMSVSDRGIRIAEARLAKTPTDSRARLYLGMSYGYRAIAHARAENIMAAALSAKSCYDRLAEVVRTNPKEADAYLGLGIFHFLFGAIPEAAQVMAGMSGIKGDAPLGIKQIGYTAANGVYFRNDARLVMALLTIYYQDNLDAGIASLSALSSRYPKNVAILYAIGSAYLEKGEPDRAVVYFDRVARQGNADFATFTQMSFGRAGTAFFQKNDFPRARVYLSKFLKYSKETTMRAYAWYLLGLCFELEGNRANAVKAYERIRSTPASPAPEDQLARKRGPGRISKPMSELDKQVMMAVNLSTVRDYKGGIASANRLLARRDLTREHKAQLQYVLGASFQGSGQPAQAVSSFETAIAAGALEETWVAPFSYYQMAQSYQALGNKRKYQEAIDKAGNYRGYDNEMVLRFKLTRDVTTID